MRKIILILFLFMLSCSNTSWHNDLGGGYAYLEYGGAMEVNDYSGDAITYKSLFDDPIVFPEIEEYKFNSNFIVCKQNYNKELTLDLLQSAFEYRYNEIYNKNSKKEYFGIVNYIIQYKKNDCFFNALTKQNTIIKTGFTKPITDSIVENNVLFRKMQKQKLNYYIIDKISNKNYLVISKSQFQELFLNLKIPDSLNID